MELTLVSSKEEIIENLINFSNYRFSNDESAFDYFKERLKKGKIFVCAIYENKYIFCPSRFVGYKNCTIQKHNNATNKNGSITTPLINRLLGENHTYNKIAEEKYLQLCTELNISPDNRSRTYWVINITSRNIDSSYNGFPDEENQPSEFLEGNVKQIYVNRYERNAAARDDCLKKHGYNCSVCSFNFESFYGDIGKNFIHVHHLKPISSIGKNYVLNPKDDLRPVCPNCHAMLHKYNPPLSIEELKLKIALQEQSNH